MRGSRQLIIDSSEFLKGMSSGAEISDGGFSPTSRGFNLTNTPGVLYAPAQATDADTDNRLSTTISIIASAPDMATVVADRRLLVGSTDPSGNGDGTFFRYDGTKIIAATYATDTTRKYARGFTDIINFGGETYVTSKTCIARWQNDNTITQNFFTFTTGTVFHPAIVFENNAYYGDGNLLLRQTAINTAPATVLTLSTDQIITAIGIDPGTGLLLISVASTFSVANTATSINRVLWYDGFSNKVRKSMIVEDLITAFHSHEGTVYVGYGTKIGYLSGSGIQFLRQLQNVTLDQSLLPFKHNFASVGNTLYVLDKNQVLAFGKVTGSSNPIFRYVYHNFIGGTASTTALSFLASGGSNRLLFGQTGEFYHFDTTSVSTIDSFSLITNFYQFPRPVYLRRLELHFVNGISSGVMDVTYKDERRNGATLDKEWGTLTTQKIHSYVGFGGDDSSDSNKVTEVQFTISMNTTNAGLKRAILYYDLGE